MVERLASPAAHELDALTDLWERSVRVTHDFLAPEDIPFFRRMVRQEALPAAEIYVIRDSGNGFAAFAGIGADRLEMLFVAPSARGKGLGRELVEHVAVHCGVQRVDVNEQNAQAAGFYARMGFRVVSRDALDPSGRPYPILHLERRQTTGRLSAARSARSAYPLTASGPSPTAAVAKKGEPVQRILPPHYRMAAGYLTSIWRAATAASVSFFLGISMVITPFSTLAAIFSRTTLSGSSRLCWNFV